MESTVLRTLPPPNEIRINLPACACTTFVLSFCFWVYGELCVALAPKLRPDEHRARGEELDTPEIDPKRNSNNRTMV
eukprot:4630926-Amphidinium_carterae.1